MKRPLVTGIGSQDVSFLAEFLLERDYEVFGIVRRATSELPENLEHVRHRVELFQGDLLNQGSLADVLCGCRAYALGWTPSTSFES